MTVLLSDPKLTDEYGRAAALARYGILDTPREQNYDKITALVCTILETPICAVSLIDRDRQWFKSAQGLDAGETPRQIAFCDHTIRSREPMMIPDALADDRFAFNPLVTEQPNIRSYLGVPLVSPDGYNLGALCVIDTKPREFTPSQFDILRNFAGLVMDEMELRTALQNDFLTGALSRRAFVEAAEREVERSRQSGETLALLLFDIDHFKAVNDAHGHLTGDQVLIAIVAAVQGQLSPSDAVGRLGGEEFGVLLKNSGVSEAFAVAERLRLAIAGLIFDGAPAMQVTSSFGIAVVDKHRDLGSGMAAADAALYRVKRGGRNRTVQGET